MMVLKQPSNLNNCKILMEDVQKAIMAADEKREKGDRGAIPIRRIIVARLDEDETDEEKSPGEKAREKRLILRSFFGITFIIFVYAFIFTSPECLDQCKTAKLERFLNVQVRKFANIKQLLDNYGGTVSVDAFEWNNFTAGHGGGMKIEGARQMRLDTFVLVEKKGLKRAIYEFAELSVKGSNEDIGLAGRPGRFVLKSGNGTITVDTFETDDGYFQSTLRVKFSDRGAAVTCEACRGNSVDIVDYVGRVEKTTFLSRCRSVPSTRFVFMAVNVVSTVKTAAGHSHLDTPVVLRRLMTEVAGEDHDRRPRDDGDGDLEVPDGLLDNACRRPNGKIVRSDGIRFGGEGMRYGEPEKPTYVFEFNATAEGGFVVDYALYLDQLQFTGDVYTTDERGLEHSARGLQMNMWSVYVTCQHPRDDAGQVCDDYNGRQLQVKVRNVSLSEADAKHLHPEIQDFWNAEFKSCAEEMLRSLWTRKLYENGILSVKTIDQK